MADDSTANFAVQVEAGPDALPEDIDRITRQLCSEIRELGVESISLTAGAAPAGAKSADALTLGALTVCVLPPMIPKLMEYLESWVGRAKQRTVKIKIQAGDRMIDVEYPSSAPDPVVEELILKMSKAIGT
jgi:hypothetical protein